MSRNLAAEHLRERQDYFEENSPGGSKLLQATKNKYRNLVYARMRDTPLTLLLQEGSKIYLDLNPDEERNLIDLYEDALTLASILYLDSNPFLPFQLWLHLQDIVILAVSLTIESGPEANVDCDYFISIASPGES